jgi:aerobic-type carbon monoxide dehydrogenase small subunit (CoxS/CutS family)
VEDEFTFKVNGSERTVTTDPARPLLEVIREDLGLTGTKYGCGEGACGACTVLMDGSPVRSCVVPVGSAAGKSIVTIEGLADGGKLHPVQEAFLAEGAMQCGYCTPGMVLTAVALLEKKPNPSEAEIVAGMNGNLCRCCGYPKIIKAIRRAAARGEK